MGSAGLLSLFIPNSITMLTMLPVLKRLDTAFKDAGENPDPAPDPGGHLRGQHRGHGLAHRLPRPTCCLIGALDYFQVPGRESVTFASWLLWFAPLAAIFLLLAWQLLARLALPRVRGGGSRAVAIDLPRYDLSPLAALRGEAVRALSAVLDRRGHRGRGLARIQAL